MRSSEQDKEVRELVEKLSTRIRERTYRSGLTSYQLDLRGRKWGNLGQQTVREHGHPSWPEEGSPAESIEEAEAQLEHYAEWILDQGERKPQDRKVVPSWKDSVQSYLDHLEEVLGADHGTFQNRRSSLHTYVLPKWKDHALTLSSRRVGIWLDGLRLTTLTDEFGRPRKAAQNTRRTVYNAMKGVWDHVFPHEKRTFDGVQIYAGIEEAQQRREDASKGIVRSSGKAYAPSQLREILVQAALYDYENIRTEPKLWARSVPNTPEAIAWATATMSRISELVGLRWRGMVPDGDMIPTVDLDRAGGFIFIFGVKSVNAPRWVPIWDAFRPWVTRMREISLSPEGFVFETPGRGERRPSDGTYADRINHAIVRAGLKRQKRRTHVFRSTGSTWVDARAQKEDLVGTLLGHSSPKKNVTDQYIDPEVLLELHLAEENGFRGYYDGWLPSPEEIYGEASRRLKEQGKDVNLLKLPTRDLHRPE